MGQSLINFDLYDELSKEGFKKENTDKVGKFPELRPGKYDVQVTGLSLANSSNGNKLMAVWQLDILDQSSDIKNFTYRQMLSANAADGTIDHDKSVRLMAQFKLAVATFIGGVEIERLSDLFGPESTIIQEFVIGQLATLSGREGKIIAGQTVAPVFWSIEANVEQ